MTRFTRRGDGVVVLLYASEQELLLRLAAQLIELLGQRGQPSPADVLFAQAGIGGRSAPPLDPALARLLPDAYRDDQEAASEHRHLTELALVQRKVENARRFQNSLRDKAAEAVLDADGIQSWLRTLTDMRLALAARLQIEVDGDAGTGDDAMLEIYDWLGYLQGSLLEVLP